MHGRRLALATTLACLTLAAPAAAQVDIGDRVIGPGTVVAGVDVSNRTVTDAAALLQAQLGPQALRPVTVKIGRRTFVLGAARAGVALDALTSAKRAYYASRDAGTAPGTAPVTPPTPPTPPTGTRAEGGAAPGLAIEPKITISKGAIRDWTTAVGGQVTRRARDATYRMTLTRMIVRPGRKGSTIDARALAARVAAEFADPNGTRAPLRQALVTVRPTKTVASLRRGVGTVLTIDRTHYRLRLFKHLRLSKSYGIAVGMAGLDTPAGRYTIANKAVNPAWHVPTSDWAGSLGGSVIPGGAPNNPLKARWLGIYNGVGIHGTAEEWSIGSRASHGCIRMRVADVIDLYPRVPVGTPVLIS
jgi:lipoprotein-anchoring transpeptidase ErfK/SrfK